MEPFWDLKIGKYVEYLTCVSSEYSTCSVLPSLTNTTGLHNPVDNLRYK